MKYREMVRRREVVVTCLLVKIQVYTPTRVCLWTYLNFFKKLFKYVLKKVFKQYVYTCG